MREHLRSLLTITNDWLKFAEAKNTLILVFCAALASAYVRGLVISVLPSTPRILIIAGVAALGGAAVSALTSFLPILRVPFVDALRAPRANDNLLYFGDIANYSPSEFLTSTAAALACTTRPDRIDEHYAAQIVTNSRIALKKYRHFTIACWLGFGGVALLTAGAAIHLLQCW
jgi:hypothetical protein